MWERKDASHSTVLETMSRGLLVSYATLFIVVVVFLLSRSLQVYLLPPLIRSVPLLAYPSNASNDGGRFHSARRLHYWPTAQLGRYR